MRGVLHALTLVALLAAQAAVAKPVEQTRGEAWRAQCQQSGGDLRGCCNALRNQCAQSCGGQVFPCAASCQACNIRCNASMDACVETIRRPPSTGLKPAGPNASRWP